MTKLIANEARANLSIRFVSISANRGLASEELGFPQTLVEEAYVRPIIGLATMAASGAGDEKDKMGY